MNFFEDHVVGTRVEIGSHIFTADEIKAFAIQFDPQPFHIDEEVAARSAGSAARRGGVFMTISRREADVRSSRPGRG